MRDELITLKTEYKDGAELKEQLIEDLFAEQKSVGRTEFYAAYASNLDVKYVFEMNPDDYECGIIKTDDGKKYYPTHILYDGEEFIISRTFKKNIQSIEVTVR